MSTTAVEETPVAKANYDDDVVLAKRSWKFPITYALATLVIIYLALKATGVAEIVWKDRRFTGDRESVLALHADQAIWVLAVLALLATAYTAWRAWNRKPAGFAAGLVVILALVLSFLLFTGGGSGRFITIAELFYATLIAAAPLMYGAFAGVICERVGVVNIAIEGQLLVGAFTGIVVANIFENGYAGLIAAPISGALIGALLAFFSVRYAVDQIIVGVVLNVLALGLTNFLLGTVVKEGDGLNSIAHRLPAIEIPGLSDIPFIGPVFFRHTIVMYILYVLIGLLTFMLFRSRWGLRMRACGEHPKAADTVGIKVNRTRFLNTMLGSALAGLGGASFTIAAGSVFTENISAGNGYIALAAMILGKWHPIGAMGAALMFGLATAIVQFLPLTGSEVDSNLLAMIPYIVTIFAVAGFVGRSRPPAAENIPYIK